VKVATPFTIRAIFSRGAIRIAVHFDRIE